MSAGQAEGGSLYELLSGPGAFGSLWQLRDPMEVCCWSELSWVFGSAAELHCKLTPAAVSHGHLVAGPASNSNPSFIVSRASSSRVAQ